MKQREEDPQMRSKEQEKYLASKSWPQGVRQVNPLGMRVLVRIRADNNQTAGGLYLPEGAKDSMNESLLAEVIEVASAIDDDTKEEANVSGIPLGSIVLIPKRAGVKVPWDDDLRIVETKDVLAIVFELNVS